MPRTLAILLIMLAVAGCQKASRSPAVGAAKAVKDTAPAKAISGWLAPKYTPRDLPIEFVASNKPEWKSLPAFWNASPPVAAGMRTSHIGLPPLQALVALAVCEDLDRIKIKVPLGLPDPTPLIPAANPATYGKWRLGKKIFHEHVLTASAPVASCVDCHHPNHGYTEARDTSDEGTRNTLSLLNVAFNKEQFWDGRVRTLEETLIESLDDEGDPSRLKALRTHRWPGTADRLDRSPEYRAEFKQVFGIDRVTQDAVAKALATYLRTILSGDSIYDRAKAGAPPFTEPAAEHFKGALTEDALKKFAAALPPGSPTDRDSVAAKIAEGQAAFLGKGGCVQCHPTGLFTNQHYYNTRGSEAGQRLPGRETGRFAALPIGMKDFAMRGAFRTPTLRNLSSTGPYLHDGSRSALPYVIEDYAVNLNRESPLLAAPLRKLLNDAGPDAVALLDQGETSALLYFLLALDGQPVDPVVMFR